MTQFQSRWTFEGLSVWYSSLIHDRGGQLQDIGLLLWTDNGPVIPPFWRREALPHVSRELGQMFLIYLQTSVIKNHVYNNITITSVVVPFDTCTFVWVVRSMASLLCQTLKTVLKQMRVAIVVETTGLGALVGSVLPWWGPGPTSVYRPESQILLPILLIHVVGRSSPYLQSLYSLATIFTSHKLHTYSWDSKAPIQQVKRLLSPV